MHRPDRWIPLLKACETEPELVRVLRDFVATIPPKDLAAIPAGAGIASLESAVDLAGIAVGLAREAVLYSGDGPARELLDSVTSVFAAAAPRLAEIQSKRVRDRFG